jgi:hypothetical protein
MHISPVPDDSALSLLAVNQAGNFDGVYVRDADKKLIGLVSPLLVFSGHPRTASERFPFTSFKARAGGYDVTSLRDSQEHRRGNYRVSDLLA